MSVAATRLRYQLDNHLGSACLELDDTARVISYEEYFPYGGTAFHAADSATDVRAKRYRYSGNERDEETGLDYVQARYYAPWLGRWTSPDPAGFVAGTNLYCYVRSNPVGLNDPTGTQPALAVEPLAPPTAAVAKTLAERMLANWGIHGEVLQGGAEAAAAAAPAAPTAAAVAPAAAAAAGEAPAAALAPEAASLAAGAAPVAAGVGVAAVSGLLLKRYMTRGGSLARYGTPYGVPSCTIPTAQCRPRLAPEPLPEPEPEPSPAPNPAPEPKPDDQDRRRLRQRVNLDTSSLITATSLKDPFMALGLQAYLATKHPVVTETALAEFLAGLPKHAGPLEKRWAALFLLGVETIPDNPSARVMNLRTDSKRQKQRLGENDKIIFGTGDQLGIVTLTGDNRFRNAAAHQGVILNILVHPWSSHAGL